MYNCMYYLGEHVGIGMELKQVESALRVPILGRQVQRSQVVFELKVGADAILEK